MRSTPSSASTPVAPVQRLIGTALLLALAAVLGYVESVLVPPLPVPGVRLGLANIAVVLALANLGARDALTVSVGRVLVVGLVAGTLAGPGSLLALAGALASWGTMALLALAGSRFSVVGWSVAGAAAHVAAQLVAASAITGSPAPLAFAPVSLFLALGCGLAIGLVCRLLLSRLPVLQGTEVVE